MVKERVAAGQQRDPDQRQGVRRHHPGQPPQQVAPGAEWPDDERAEDEEPGLHEEAPDRLVAILGHCGRRSEVRRHPSGWRGAPGP